jgi:hypothetical protein
MSQSPKSIAYMRQMLPAMIKLLLLPASQDSLRTQQVVFNWDEINAIERECGLPETQCPNTDVLKRLGLGAEGPDAS